MLSDERIDAITDQQWGKPTATVMYQVHRAYARAIEHEATSSLIEQIKEDEALMRQVLSWIAATDPQYAWSVESRYVKAIRQRLENNK